MVKKNGSFQMVVNLQSLSCFAQIFHFKIKDFLQVWMCTLELKDVYLSVGVVQKHRRLALVLVPLVRFFLGFLGGTRLPVVVFHRSTFG